MRICIDIDGTICRNKQPHENYIELQPIEGAVSNIKKLKDAGHYIILCTARHMRTCEANVGRVVALQGEILMAWLRKHEFLYDELWFGKPYADLYIDDKALRFEGSWNSINLKDVIKKYYE